MDKGRGREGVKNTPKNPDIIYGCPLKYKEEVRRSNDLRALVFVIDFSSSSSSVRGYSAAASASVVGR